MREEADSYSEQGNFDANCIQKFEQMLGKGDVCFFDTVELESIIEQYVESGNYKKAFEAIRIGTSQHPDHDTFQVLKAELFTLISQPRKALDVLDNLSTLEYHNVDFLITKSAALSQMGDNQQAIKHLKDASKMATGELLSDIYYNIAGEYQKMANNNKAIKYLKEALQLNPSHEDALYELGFCFDEEGRLQEAVVYYQQFIDHHPYSYTAWYNLGCIYSKMVLYRKAEEAFDYALVIKDDFTAACFNKANMLFKLCKYDEAIELYKTTLHKNLPDALTYYYIGDCYEKMGIYNKALTYYNKTIKKDPYLADAWVAIGLILNHNGKHSEGIHYLKRGLELESDNATYWQAFAEAQDELGFVDEAIEAFNRATELQPYNPELWIAFSDALFHYEEYKEEAIIKLIESTKYNENEAALYYRLVAYYIALGRQNEAYDMLQRGLEINYDMHRELLKYMPEVKNCAFVVDLIEHFKTFS